MRAIQDAATRGTSYGAPTEQEVRFAEAVTALYPSIEMLRAVSSGTEAAMSAARVARGFTGRDGIIKAEGCYHGHADFFLVKAGSGLATFGAPDSAGVPVNTARAFSASALDQFGIFMNPQPSFTWTAIGAGYVNSVGTFFAGPVAGPATVTATTGGVTGTAQVIVY